MPAETMVKTRWVYAFGGGRADGRSEMSPPDPSLQGAADFMRQIPRFEA